MRHNGYWISSTSIRYDISTGTGMWVKMEYPCNLAYKMLFSWTWKFTPYNWWRLWGELFTASSLLSSFNFVQMYGVAPYSSCHPWSVVHQPSGLISKGSHRRSIRSYQNQITPPQKHKDSLKLTTVDVRLFFSRALSSRSFQVESSEVIFNLKTLDL